MGNQRGTLRDDLESGPVSRALSLALAVSYVLVAVSSGSIGTTLKVFSFCLLPVACIWFPDVLGEYTGYGLGGGFGITARSPAIMVWLAGWFVLLVPLIALTLIYFLS